MIAESCSCGASFQADRPKDELKLVRMWRNEHNCNPSGSLAIVDVARSETAHPLGFMATGLIDPSRSPYEPDWDEE